MIDCLVMLSMDSVVCVDEMEVSESEAKSVGAKTGLLVVVWCDVNEGGCRYL